MIRIIRELIRSLRSDFTNFLLLGLNSIKLLFSVTYLAAATGNVYFNSRISLIRGLKQLYNQPFVTDTLTHVVLLPQLVSECSDNNSVESTRYLFHGNGPKIQQKIFICLINTKYLHYDVLVVNY